MSATFRYCRAAAFAAVAIFGLSHPARAAEPIPLQSDNVVARWLLPYAPFVFDLAVQASRSVAEITYAARSYDAVAGDFVVSDLHVRRDSLDLKVRRLRVGEFMMIADGIAVETRSFELPPPLREGLQRLGRETVVGTVVAVLKRDDTRSAFSLDLSADLEGIGALSASAAVDGFHALMPLQEMSEGFSPKPQILGFFTGGSATYRDAGLAKVAYAIAAKQSGVTPAEMQNGIAVLPTTSVGDLMESMPGGASPALRAEARGWARTLEQFLRKPDALTISFDPKQPVPLSAFEAGQIDEPLIAALNPSVRAGAAPIAAPASDAVSVAAAQIGGDTMIQDRGKGTQALIALADSGELRAVSRLAGAFPSTRVPVLPPAELGKLYEYLLVARALDARVSDATLAAVSGRLPPETLRAAERDAAAFFREKTEAGKERPVVSADTIGRMTINQLRSAAYDTYEGRGVPRDFTEAYALALVAAAEGDQMAISLRDHLTTAIDGRAVVMSADEARARASALWAARSVPKTP